MYSKGHQSRHTEENMMNLLAPFQAEGEGTTLTNSFAIVK